MASRTTFLLPVLAEPQADDEKGLDEVANGEDGMEISQYSLFFFALVPGALVRELTVRVGRIR